MQFFNFHAPHFQHFSPHNALVSLREKLSENHIEVAMTLTIMAGLLIVLTFWAVVAH